MQTPKLYMLLLGCRPKGRLIEQHDIFFGIANSLAALVPAIKAAWPEAKGNIHIDACRVVAYVDQYQINVVARNTSTVVDSSKEAQLFFINLGGYQVGDFEERHAKLLRVASNLDEAKQQAKQSIFYKTMGFKGATSHIDDKYGVDVDEIFSVEEILAPAFKDAYSLVLSPRPASTKEDEIHLGYLPIHKIAASKL